MGVNSIKGPERKTWGLKRVQGGPWHHHHRAVLRLSWWGASHTVLAGVGDTRKQHRSRSSCSQLFCKSWVGMKRSVAADAIMVQTEPPPILGHMGPRGGDEGGGQIQDITFKVLLHSHPRVAAVGLGVGAGAQQDSSCSCCLFASSSCCLTWHWCFAASGVCVSWMCLCSWIKETVVHPLPLSWPPQCTVQIWFLYKSYIWK